MGQNTDLAAVTHNASPQPPPTACLNVNFGSIIKSESDFDEEEHSGSRQHFKNKTLGHDAFQSPKRPQNKESGPLEDPFKNSKHIEPEERRPQ